jgi:hypothetical protein
MDRRILNLKLTPEQTSDLRYYTDLWHDGECAIFSVLKSSYNAKDQCINLNLEAACPPWGEAIKVVNILRKLFGQKPIQHRAKRAKPTPENE